MGAFFFSESRKGQTAPLQADDKLKPGTRFQVFSEPDNRMDSFVIVKGTFSFNELTDMFDQRRVSLRCGQLHTRNIKPVDNREYIEMEDITNAIGYDDQFVSVTKEDHG